MGYSNNFDSLRILGQCKVQEINSHAIEIINILISSIFDSSLIYQMIQLVLSEKIRIVTRLPFYEYLIVKYIDN